MSSPLRRRLDKIERIINLRNPADKNCAGVMAIIAVLNAAQAGEDAKAALEACPPSSIRSVLLAYKEQRGDEDEDYLDDVGAEPWEALPTLD